MDIDQNINRHRLMSNVITQCLQSNIHYSSQFKKLIISRFLTENIIVLLLQYMGLMFFNGLNTSVIAPLWFASGSACAFIFMRGYSVLPGIFLGSVFAYYITSHYFLYSVTAGTIDAFQAFALLWISYRYISPALVFASAKKLIQFVLVCGILTAFITVLHVFNFQSLFHHITLPAYLQWWLGNLNGILIFGSAIAAWDAYFPQIDELKSFNKFELVLCYGLLLILIVSLLFAKSQLLFISCSLLTTLFIFCTAKYFKYCGVIAALLLFGLLVNFVAYLGLHFSSEKLIFLQILLAVAFIMSAMSA